MVFIRLIRFLMGYVVFTAKGGFPERFINLCANHSVALWDVKCVGNSIRASATAKAYKLIREPARKSGMLPRISERHGLPFFLNRYKRRVGLLAGAAVAMIILALLSSMLWSVTVEGNEKVSAEELSLYLEELGVKSGSRRSGIDIPGVQKEILNKFPELSWASLNITGSKANLEVRERISPPEMFDINAPCNIIASHDGEIVRLDAYTGEAVAQTGSAVVKGDLLISGVMQSKLYHYYVHAKGTVIARTIREITSEAEKNPQSERIAREKIRYSLYLFGIKIPFGTKLKEYGEYSKHQSFASSNGTVLPVGMIRERFSVFEECAPALSEEQAALICITKYYHEYRDILSEAEIISAEIKTDSSDSAYKITGKYRLEENIGVEQYFQVEEQAENTLPKDQQDS